MKLGKLTYGVEGFKEIEAYLRQFKQEGYTLSIFDIMKQSTAEIECSFDDMLKVIELVSSIEHDFPAWIGTNDLSESYVVGMNFTRGKIETPAAYKFEDNKLTKKYSL